MFVLRDLIQNSLQALDRLKAAPLLRISQVLHTTSTSLVRTGWAFHFCPLVSFPSSHALHCFARSDVRLIAFNKTTLCRGRWLSCCFMLRLDLRLDLPPPWGFRQDWSWEDLKHYACKVKAQRGTPGAPTTLKSVFFRSLGQLRFRRGVQVLHVAWISHKQCSRSWGA